LCDVHIGASVSEELAASISFKKEQQVPSKHRYLSTKLHGVTSQKTVILVGSLCLRPSTLAVLLCYFEG
jgi:hypothetical protein